MHRDESDETITIAAETARLEAALDRIAALAQRPAAAATQRAAEHEPDSGPGPDLAAIAHRLDHVISRLRAGLDGE